MTKAMSALLVLAGAAGASAATITETVQFDYDPFQGTTELVLNGFDTLGGTRELRRATFEYQHNFNLDIFLESTGPTAVNVGDFSLSVGYINIHQLGTVNNGAGGFPPFFTAGGFYLADMSADLDAYDGVPGNNGPDSTLFTYDDSFIANFVFGQQDAPFLDVLTDTGPLATVFGGFTEMFFFWVNDPNWPLPDGFFPDYPDDAALWVTLQDFRHFGELTIKYKYRNIPAPAAAAPLALLPLALRRRRV